MKTYNRNNVSNPRQAKKNSKHLRELRKCGGNIAVYSGSLTPKSSFVVKKRTQEGWEGYIADTYGEGWDD